MIKIENVDIHGIARAVYSARNAIEAVASPCFNANFVLNNGRWY